MELLKNVKFLWARDLRAIIFDKFKQIYCNICENEALAEKILKKFWKTQNIHKNV